MSEGISDRIIENLVLEVEFLHNEITDYKKALVQVRGNIGFGSRDSLKNAMSTIDKVLAKYNKEGEEK